MVRLEIESGFRRGDAIEIRGVVQCCSGNVGIVEDPVLKECLGVTVVALSQRSLGQLGSCDDSRDERSKKVG